MDGRERKTVGTVVGYRVESNELLVSVRLSAPVAPHEIDRDASIGGFHYGTPLGTDIQARFEGMRESGQIEVSVFDGDIAWAPNALERQGPQPRRLGADRPAITPSAGVHSRHNPGVMRQQGTETRRLAGTARSVGARNPITGRRRIPWRDLDDRARRRRYGQAVRARRAGFPGRDPGTFEEYAAVQQRLDGATPTTPTAPADPVVEMPQGPVAPGLLGVYDAFKKGGPLDAQPYLADQNGVVDKGGTAYGNLAFGAFMAGAGFSLGATLFAADTYGRVAQKGGAYKPEMKAGKMSGNIPVDNALNVINGFKSSGKPGLCH